MHPEFDPAHLTHAIFTVFFFYDCVITLGQEISLYWTSKLTGASALFVAVKYTTILYNILFLVVWSPNLSDKVFDMFFYCSVSDDFL